VARQTTFILMNEHSPKGRESKVHRDSWRVSAQPFFVVGRRQDNRSTPMKKRRASATLLEFSTRRERVVYFTCRAQCEACDAAVRPRPTAADRRP
jgi:hypothetical protein